MDEIADQRQWEKAFARSEDQLTRLAVKVRDDIQAGRVKNIGVDEL